MRNISFILTLIVVSLLMSCRAYKPAAYTPLPLSATSENEYIKAYRNLAISEMHRTGVPASITLAQGIIESNYGRSTLSREANNHFGIKCHNGWTGPGIHHNDDRRNECFRKYNSPIESFQDHSDFLRTGSRYSFLFSLPSDDYKGWARGLKKAGYATNPDYADMLIRKIEEMNLAIYDREYIAKKGPVEKSPVDIIKNIPVEKSPTGDRTFAAAMEGGMDSGTVTASAGEEIVLAPGPRVLENNRIQYIIVNDGDSREKIEDEFSLLKWELPRYNDLGEEFGLSPGQILYLQPKRDKAEPGKNTYTTVEGDTMYLVSQKFGIKLTNLYEMNRMGNGTEPLPGTRLWLRSLKPVN